MMHTSAKAALGTYTNLAAECKVLPEDSEYIEKQRVNGVSQLPKHKKQERRIF